MNTLYEARKGEIPPLPQALHTLAPLPVLPTGHLSEEIRKLFPNLAKAKAKEHLERHPLRVGVLLSGGQAPGGHNVINGLLDGLQKLHPESKLMGFLEGPQGLIADHTKRLDREFVRSYLNTGGFDMIGSGRTKIETPEQFLSSLKTAQKHSLEALIIIGGDDSNTNAALLAEYFIAHHQPTAVIGVPKTIDGDLKNSTIEQSFGFDTAVKVYAEIVGNLLKDALSAKKYWYFIKLMGRSASHITLEVALQTHPNLTLISEERKSLEAIVEDVVQLIELRAQEGKNYGALLIPEGIIEFMPQLPSEIVQGASYDAHGNLEVSKIESERFLIELVKKRLDPSWKFAPMPVFLGYEGRSAFPSFFDASYGYALGYVAALLAAQKATGCMASLAGLKNPVATWKARGVPLIGMLTLEVRKGVLKPVIAKSLVDLHSEKYGELAAYRSSWKLHDDYRSPGPIQFWGPRALVEGTVF